MDATAAILETPHSGTTTRPAVLVFRTSVNTNGQIMLLEPALMKLLGNARWSFDLEDRDRVLRVVHGPVVRDEVIALLHRTGFLCAELD